MSLYLQRSNWQRTVSWRVALAVLKSTTRCGLLRVGSKDEVNVALLPQEFHFPNCGSIWTLGRHPESDDWSNKNYHKNYQQDIIHDFRRHSTICCSSFESHLNRNFPPKDIKATYYVIKLYASEHYCSSLERIRVSHPEPYSRSA